MKTLPLEKLGPRELSDNRMQFGVLLPWVSAKDGNSLSIKIIHEKDQFIQNIKPKEFQLKHSVDDIYGDYWSTVVDIDAKDNNDPKSAWGKDGRYLYRYQLKNPNRGTIDWIVDPFAREFGVGKQSAFTLNYKKYEWTENENAWKTPDLYKLIIYELMINEFAGGLKEAANLLPYLADLGINCIEVMPVSNVDYIVEWGYTPIGYYGVDERFGKRYDFQAFVDIAHQNGIAVIMDAVYGHTSNKFPYEYLYSRLGYHENPFMGAFAKNDFGPSTDFNREITRDYFYTVNMHWLDAYHLDGFRYDCVPNFWEGPTDKGYSNLVYNTHQTVRSKQADAKWQRFFLDGKMNLIQCAEQLECPSGILWQSYSNCTWQDSTYNIACGTAKSGEPKESLASFGLSLGLSNDNYPWVVDINGEHMQKTALQYIENHDHSSFLCNFGEIADKYNSLMNMGDRSRWFKAQPYLIGLLTSKGIPLLWQGQEFGSNYVLPKEGMARVKMFRPVDWGNFYDEYGQGLVTLMRRLIKLRANGPQFTSEHFNFHNDWNRYQSQGLLLFTRETDSRYSLIALNFSDTDRETSFTFERSGAYGDELHDPGNMPVMDVTAGVSKTFEVPSNYGRVWTLQ